MGVTIDNMTLSEVISGVSEFIRPGAGYNISHNPRVPCCGNQVYQMSVWGEEED